MTTVVDASTVVAALTDSGVDGVWAEAVLTGDDLAAPELMLVEASNVLRRLAVNAVVSETVATDAFDALLELRVELFPFRPLASRVWSLRSTVTAYDGWYIALAEAIGAPLATLDTRLARSAESECEFLLPPPR